MRMLPALRPAVAAALLAWALLPLSAPAAPAPPAADRDAAAANPAEKAREALDRAVTLRIDRLSLAAAVAQLRDKAKLNIAIDNPSIQQLGFTAEQPPAPVQLDVKDVKARAALRKMLDPYGLTFVVVGDAVVVTTEDAAAARQMSQRVSVNLDKVELAAALKQISRDAGVNLALDPRAEKEASARVSLQVEEIPLETAVRLLSEMAGLKPVRAGNTLFVTKKEVAAEMRGDPDLNPAPRKTYLDSDRDFVIVNGLNNAALWQVQGRVIRAPPPPPAPPASVTEPSSPKQIEEKPPADPKDANPPPAKEGDK
jgi:hypothetical protein